MASPLPKVLYDIGPGGGINTVMNANNALANNMHLREINRVKAKYQPWITQADVNSKNAYAQLIGLQPFSKLQAHDPSYWSLTDAQRRALAEREYRAGSGQGISSPGTNNLNLGPPPGEDFNPLAKLGMLGKKFMSIFDAPTSQGTAQAPPANSLVNPQPNMPMQAPAPMQSGGAPTYTDEAGNNDAVLNAYEHWNNSPEGMRERAKGENANYLNEQEVLAWDKAHAGKPPIEMELVGGKTPQRQETVAETAGRQKGIMNQGAESGKTRVVSQKELDQDYQQALQLKQPFKKINEIITNPVFQKARQIPGFQKLQMNLKTNIGSPEEKKLIAEFQSAAINVVAATVKGFGGRILASEIPLAQSMKLSDNDTIEAMIAKAPVIEEFNEMTLQRSKLASKLVEDEHLNKGAALEKADKMLDGEAIRQQVANELKAKPSEEDYKIMMQKYGKSKDEIKTILKARGLI